MSRKGITVYDLLLSCPSDVVQFFDVIKECVEQFNKTIGSVNNCKIELNHWSTDSYPQSGGKPQDILNETLVKKCDAAVAIFWTKFGTPTDKYGSGTEEEIEKMLSSNKQVFVYFLDKPIPPSDVINSQYSKVKKFKERYKDKGIYSEVKDEAELRKQFTNHLAMHFLQIISGTETANNVVNTPCLKIKDAVTMSDVEATVEYTDFSNCDFLTNKKEEIKNKISLLNSTCLPLREKSEDDVENNKESISYAQIPNYNDVQNFNLNDFYDKINKTEVSNAEVSQSWKNIILEFVRSNDIQIDPNFWNVGKLKKKQSINGILKNQMNLQGSEQEKQRYEALEQLYLNVEEYNVYKKYFSEIDNLPMLFLVISNDGTTFDEDIDVKLTVNKGIFVNLDKLPYPQESILKAVFDNNYLDAFFKTGGDENILEYNGYPIDHDRSESINREISWFFSDERREMYLDKLRPIFCYEYFRKDDKDILKFHINYLKQHTAMAFPSYLIFNKVPTIIKYEISSKFSPDVATGKIVILQKAVENNSV